jgi:acetamidase/formamidase
LDHRRSRQGSQHRHGARRAQPIDSLASRAKLSPHDAYALCSIAASFWVTQVVDIVHGVHAMIPKSLFAGELRRQIAVV